MAKKEESRGTGEHAYWVGCYVKEECQKRKKKSRGGRVSVLDGLLD